ncbi:MFS transporter [Leifsonia sp. NPDC056665]|uniref:MFS transporter n=1 Tax=Leifsonia sp. NPDC056665 TaxID=3345901 RepID=UPI0036BB8841
MRHSQTKVTTFLLGLQQALLIPFLSLFAVRELGLQPLGLFVFLLAFHGSGLAVSLALPAMMDRFGRGGGSFQVLTALAAVGFGLFALPLNAGMATLIAGFLLGPASAQNSVFFAALKTSGTSRSGLLTTRGLFTVAWVAGPLVGSLIQGLTGFVGLFISLALLNLFVLLLAPLRHVTGPPASSPLVESDTPARSKGQLWSAFVALVCLYGTNVIATTTMPIVMTGLQGGTSAMAGIAFAVSAALEALVLFCFARWSTQRRERTLIIAACVPGAIYYILLATTGAPWLLVVGQLPNAIFISAAVGLGMTWFQSLMPARPGFATGLFMNASRIASLATAPLIAGASSVTGSYQSVNWLAAALLIPAILLLATVRRSHRQFLPDSATPAASEVLD